MQSDSDSAEAPVNAVPRVVNLFGRTVKVNRIWVRSGTRASQRVGKGACTDVVLLQVANFMIVFFTVLSTGSIVVNVMDFL